MFLTYNLHLYGVVITTVPAAAGSSIAIFTSWKIGWCSLNFCYVDKMMTWGWEVPSVSHSTFWPLRVHHPGSQSALCHHKCQLECSYAIEIASVSAEEHKLRLSVNLCSKSVWHCHDLNLAGRGNIPKEELAFADATPETWPSSFQHLLRST